MSWEIDVTLRLPDAIAETPVQVRGAVDDYLRASDISAHLAAVGITWEVVDEGRHVAD